MFRQENKTRYGLGESVSFGRYMSDNSLEWERWSSFNNSNSNRYVEEAKNYSKPGSVAQKKAYFEAHFKRMAALKAAAAALLDQANAAENISEGQVTDTSGNAVQNLSSDAQTEENKYDEEVEKVENNGECKDVIEGFAVHENELYSVAAEDAVNPTKPEDSINCNGSDKPSLKEEASFSKEASTSIVKKNPPLSSYMSPTVGETGRSSQLSDSAAAKYAGSVYPGKENYATPMKNKSSVSDPDKKRTPLRMSINREINKILSPVIRKIGSSSKASKDCSTPLRTPAKASENGVPEPPPMTPSRGSRSRLDSSTCESKAPGSRWHIFSSDASMSPSVGRHKIGSPIIPSSFCMRGDRAARRKQKLEDKFNATATEKAPQTLKFKEKAEAELNKLRQSFCFKAMSSPDHYIENETLTNPKQKNDSTHGKSPKRGRQSNRSTSTQSKSLLPPRRPAVKQGGSKDGQQKNSSALRMKRNSDEN